MLARHFEGAATGRRTQNWYRASTDANAAAGTSLSKLRDVVRDLVRNNAYAASGLETIVTHTVGWGIVAAQAHSGWLAWADSTACDADGRNDLYGLEELVLRSVAESGEVLVRRRWRRLEDGLPLPMQLQVLEADFLDTNKDGRLPSGHRVIQGVEFDLLGRRVAYWLFKEHPGSSHRSASTLISTSQRVSADDVLHVFRQDRPGQVRGPSWFAPVVLTAKDFDELKDATLMKQKVAACLSIVTTDVNGDAPALGVTDASDPTTDSLAPGMVLNLPPGREVTVVNPPTVAEFGEYSKTTLREIATGLGVSYEDLTGDYTALPFSAARMSRLRHWSRVEKWRWRLLIPQFLNPVWGWAMQAAELAGQTTIPVTKWTTPALPMMEPDKEGLAIQRNIRAGIQTHSEAIRERGYNPDTFIDELVADFKRLDDKQLVLDIDPRKMTQAGQAQGSATATAPPATGTTA
jgi:lambda family phage portal protein